MSRLPFEGTTVSAERTQGQIGEMLRKHGITSHQWTNFPVRADLRFKMGDGQYLFAVPVSDDQREAWRLFRVLHWYIKALLEMAESGLFLADQVFLPYREIGPGVTMADVSVEPARMEAVLDVFGGSQLVLGPADVETEG